MFDWFRRWRIRPTFRDRVLDALSIYELSALEIAQIINDRWPPFGRVFNNLVALEREGVVESRFLPGPRPRKRLYRRAP